MTPDNNEPNSPDDSSLTPEEKLKFINDVLRDTKELLKNAFSPEQFINDVYALTCMENDFKVSLTPESIKVESHHRGTEEVKWSEIKKVSIVTNDKGPFTADVFMVLLTDIEGCVIPQGNNYYTEVYDKVTAFENVNFENVIKAMSSSENNEFVIWKSK